jgi:hypothetical protein
VQKISICATLKLAGSRPLKFMNQEMSFEEALPERSAAMRSPPPQRLKFLSVAKM